MDAKRLQLFQENYLSKGEGHKSLHLKTTLRIEDQIEQFFFSDQPLTIGKLYSSFAGPELPQMLDGWLVAFFVVLSDLSF